MAELLADALIEAALHELPGWEREGESIVKTYRRRDWPDAIALVNLVAPEAETRNHHPDVSVIDYRFVIFRLTTHSAGGITQRDVDLATRIDELAAGEGAPDGGDVPMGGGAAPAGGNEPATGRAPRDGPAAS